MLRLAVMIGIAVALAACADHGSGKAWYDEGDANYDALKRADDACKAGGGTFVLKDGGDPTSLGDYACKTGKGS